MRKILTLAGAILTFGVLAAAAPAADPPVVAPFPSAISGPLFVAAQTVTPTGSMSSWFTPGATIVFRAFAVDAKAKTHKVLATKDVKYFYVTIPNQPNVKLSYLPTAPGATARMPWVGTWVVPADYAQGIVNFKVLVKSEAKRIGQFVQMPVAASMLNISATAPVVLGNGPAVTALTAGVSSPDIAIYVDTVNGTSPVAAPKRAVGCTQTNVYKRGEQLVIRTWGTDLSTGQPLTTDNVDTATYTVPGQAPVPLPYGAHGAVGNKVMFWAAAWNIPPTFALGDLTIHVAYTTDTGKTGFYDYTITIIP
jgi:hypothetical protein